MTARGIRTYARLGRLDGKRYIEVRFEIPEEGETVKLVETSAKMFSNSSSTMTEIEFRKIYLSPFASLITSSDLTQMKMLEIHEPMEGETKNAAGIDWPASYWLGSYVELPDTDKLHIVLPQFAVNGEVITLPSIQFDRKWVVAFAVINC